ncbi:PR-1-like protein [Xylariaceae sp. FL0804]|nr:PR-1-like protein [Xylariaceae sp. FL0804]
MKYSALLVATAAAVTMAGPVAKRDVVFVTDVNVVETYYTVTVGAEPAAPTTEAPVVWVTVTAGAEQAPAATPVETPTETKKVVAQSTPTAQSSNTFTTTSTDSGSDSGSDSDDMQTAAINQHNLHRANHSAPEMTWNSEIAGYAALTAQKCVFAHDMDEGNGGYGQNIAMWAQTSGAEALGDAGAIKMATTDMWYNGEFENYQQSYYGLPTPPMGDFEAWGHISQLLWKSSTELGCATQFCAKGTMYSDMDAWYMVCNYGPPGNVANDYGTNVLKPLGEPVVYSR